MRINNQKFYIQLLSLFSLSILLIGSLNLSRVSAEGGDDSIVEIEGANVELTVDAPYSLTKDDGTLVFFDTVEDYNAYLDSQIIKIVPICATCNKTTTTTITTNTAKEKWVNYHPLTNAWAKASSYTISRGKSYTISGSYSYDGFNVGVSVAHNTSVSTTIPANSKKYSRLGVWSDITFKRFKHIVKSPTGKVINTYYSNTAYGVGAPYIKVKYK
jgi:hypothetical protein